MRIKRHLWTITLALLCAAPCRAGSVVMNDGAVLNGTVTLVPGDQGNISIQIPGKPAQTCKFSDVRSALFDSLASPDSGPQEDFVPWARAEVSVIKRPRLAEIKGQSITIKDASDAFHIGKNERASHAVYGRDRCFVFQRLEWDGEIVAHLVPGPLVPVPPVNPAAPTTPPTAGIMICEGLDNDGPRAILSRDLSTTASATLRLRPALGEPVFHVNQPQPPEIPATWLKLRRSWDTFQAFDSVDGETWNLLAEGRVEMDDKKGVYIGVTADSPDADIFAAFDHVHLTGRRTAASVPGATDPRLPDVFIRLKDGSVLAGLLQSIAKDQAQIKKTGGEDVNLPLNAVATAQFAPLTHDDLDKIAAATAGALTREGDFLDGEIKSVNVDRLTVSSVNFGLTNMERRQVSLLIFQTASPSEPHLTEVRLQDGSLVLARTITVDKDQLVITEPLLGDLKYPLTDIVSVERKP